MNKTHEPSWLAQAVFYEIYPACFRDSNGDGIGDIAGMISQLDYLRRLGVNALWINPWYVSSFRDGGYDITDFMRPDPRYGTLAEARNFFREAHRHGIRVVLDLVAGHTSLEHPYFQESCRGTGSRHQDFYIWNPNSVYRGTAEQYYIAGLFPRGSYCANFFASQPAINYGFNKVENSWEMSCDHPACRANREWLISVMRYWLDLGCDGFRVDMASSIIKRDPGFEKTSQFWQSVRTLFDREYPEAVLLAEWFMPERSLAAGFHLDFVPPSGLFRNDSWSCSPIFSGEILFSAATKKNDGKWLDGYRKLCDVCNPAGLCLFSGTHDQWRLSYFGSDRETMVKLAFMTALPAPPFFYYGDEIGMRHLVGVAVEGSASRGGARTPMQWDHSRNFGFSTAAPEKLYLPTDSAAGAPTVEDALAGRNPLFTTVRELIRLRREHPALGGDGALELDCPENFPLRVTRRLAGETIFAAFNPSGETVSFPLPGTWETLLTRGVVRKNEMLLLEPVSFIFLRKAASQPGGKMHDV